MGESKSDAEVLAEARTWLELDPDHASQLKKIIDDAVAGDTDSLAELHELFSAPLKFGTAGLRAAVGPGIARMNRVVVRRAAAGIADFALHTLAAETTVPKVVIGFDARADSAQFAQDSAAVFTRAGLETFLMPFHTPTPVLAFTVNRMRADIGVMVTASHNPPQDNGYKVYLGSRLLPTDDPWGAGAQITTPVDEHIAAHITALTNTGVEPELADGGHAVVDEQIISQYCHSVTGFLNELPTISRDLDREQLLASRRELKIVYTPLHGVGAATFSSLMSQAGFGPLIPVTEQLNPDPAFPTVEFPNPEEPGALDLACSVADSVGGADLIIAHDPDADRVAVAVEVEGEWQMLTGDQTGAILGSHLLPVLAQRNQSVANSVVSGTQLARLAAHYGVAHTQTLTGFKWISRTPHLGFGYEEALGHCVAPHIVRDKDGLSAAVVLADLAAQLKSQGQTLVDYLAGIDRLVGPATSQQIALRLDNIGVAQNLMHRVRSHPLKDLAGVPVNMVKDYREHSPPTDLIHVQADGNQASLSLKIRPSGTEPKLKCYLTVQGSTGTSTTQVGELMAGLVEQAEQYLSYDETQGEYLTHA